VTDIGQAIARLFAHHGAKVAVVDKAAAAAELTVRRSQEEGGECAAMVGDLTREADCQRVVNETLTRWGRLDVLVNNVGVVARGAVAELELDELTRTMDLNFTTAFLMSKFSIPYMKDGGSIVHLSSTASEWPSEDTAYAVAKGAVETLSRSIAVQYARRRIRSNVVQPGFVWTEMAARQYEDEAARARVQAGQRAVSALQMVGTAWDVAAAALFFASEEARWVTAQLLTVDGGAAYRRPDFDAARGFRADFDDLANALKGRS
jgi:NAD(P)-dependent dehydrogenase (short-subunit alcohol dehydrogenase family)